MYFFSVIVFLVIKYMKKSKKRLPCLTEERLPKRQKISSIQGRAELLMPEG